MEKGQILILCFEFNFASSFNTIAFFLDFWAKKSNLEYQIYQDNQITKLFIKGNQEELNNFNDNLLVNVPHSVFLRQSKVELADNFPNLDKACIVNFSSNLITPYSLKNQQNEFGFKINQEIINKGIDALNNGNNFEYDGFIFSKFDNFDCDFLVPTKINLLPKIFVADEKSLIALASFEKPLIRLKTTALFRNAHKNAPLDFLVRTAWDINIYKICEKLNFNFLKVLSKKDCLNINILQDFFLPISNTIFLKQSDLNLINSKNDKNLALFGLKLNEFNLLENTVANIFLSKSKDDFINIFKENNEYEVLKINTPKTFEEIYDIIKSQENGETLINNFKEKFVLPLGQTHAKNSFFGLFTIIQKILNSKNKICSLADDFTMQKGVRIDFGLKNNNEFECIKVIKSVMSYALAGADNKNIAFGLIESLAYFISDFGDTLKNEFECENFIISGSLFESKSLCNILLKITNKNYKFSEQYPLEIS